MKKLVAMGLVGVALGGCAAQSAEEGSRMHAFGAVFVMGGIGEAGAAAACFVAAGDASGGASERLIAAGIGFTVAAVIGEWIGWTLLGEGDRGFERELERAAPVRIVERPTAPAQVRGAPEVAPVETSTAALEQLTPLQRWIREKEAAKRAR